MADFTQLFWHFTPDHYDLTIRLDALKLTFDGMVTIYGYKKDDDPTLQLHAKDIDIEHVIVNGKAQDYVHNDDILRINLAKLSKGTLEVQIRYHGIITKSMHGIYPAYPNDGSIMLGTQFESHHAREAFPCIDEPAAKATFDITLTSDAPVMLSNMPAETTTANDDGTKTVKFARTPIMSSYLVAFITGDLQSVATQTQDGTEIRVWSSKDHEIESLVFPLEVAVKTTEFLNDYFGIAYPLPKCDHVALPDFSSGAMENWGLITYREVALITDPKTVSTSAKEYIATVIAHEISHQWFGNLVTMQWWDDLWLNESFATLMEYLVIDAIYPDWNVMLRFAANEALSAYRRDVLPGVQPVATPVHHPDAISSLFDPSIVYAKGARLLYMAYHLVGDRNFKKGLRNYFKTHAYGNTTGDDLWHALGSVSGIDVASIMHPWITQPGFPYLKINVHDDDTVEIAQQRLSTEQATSDQLWPVPLWRSGVYKREILDTRQMQLHVTDAHGRFNTIGGHYIPHYSSAETKQRIYEAVQKHQIRPDGRLLLLHDPLLLARCGVASLTEALESLSYYEKEADESVWSVISLVISDTRMMVEANETVEAVLRAFTYRLINRQYDRVGFITESSNSNNDKKLRSIVSSLAVYSETPTVIDAALAIYSSHSVESVPADSRASILTAAVKNGGANIFDDLLNKYPSFNSSDIQADIAGALCATKNKKQINQLLNKLKDPSFVRLQDLDRFVIYLLRNQKSRPFAWDWLVGNWEWITEVFARDKSYDNYPRYAASVFSSEKWLRAYKKHFAPLQSIPSLARNIELGTKDIESKIAWRLRDQHIVESWLLEWQRRM